MVDAFCIAGQQYTTTLKGDTYGKQKEKKVYANKLEQLEDELATAAKSLHNAQEKYQAKKSAVSDERERLRTNRLCTRGGHQVKYLEEPELFTDKQIAAS